MAEKDTRTQVFIPENYENNINVQGFSFKTRNLIEAAVFGFPLALATFFVSYEIIMFNLQISLYLALAVFVIIAIICIRGINEDCFTKYIKCLIKSRMNKRIAIYNPKIKTRKINNEDQYYYSEEALLPRDKIEAMFKKYTEKINIQNSQIKEDELKEGEYIFIDDADNSNTSIFTKMKGALLNVREKNKNKEEEN